MRQGLHSPPCVPPSRWQGLCGGTSVLSLVWEMVTFLLIPFGLGLSSFFPGGSPESGEFWPYNVMGRRAAGEAWAQVGETVSLQADEHISWGPWPCAGFPGDAPWAVVPAASSAGSLGRPWCPTGWVPGFQASRVQSPY